MIRSTVHEQIRMMSARRTEHAHYAGECRVHPRAHVERLHRQPGRIDADHLMSSRSSSAHSRAAEAGQCTLILLDPRRSSMRITQSASALTATGTKAAPPSIGTLCGAGAASTGSVAPPSDSTTQRRSRFAFNPRASATAAIETPGWRQAATDSARNAALWRRRRRRPILSACGEVFTCPPNFKWTRMLLRYRPTRKMGSPAGYAVSPAPPDHLREAASSTRTLAGCLGNWGNAIPQIGGQRRGSF
jgi:hypothetical protein